MPVLDKLERRFGRYGVPNVTLGLIALQIVAFVGSLANPAIVNNLALIPQKILDGQFWRLFTFLAIPPMMNPIFALFFWYLFFLMGTSLERQWGAFRYNIYLLVGYFATIAASFLTP